MKSIDFKTLTLKTILLLFFLLSLPKHSNAQKIQQDLNKLSTILDTFNTKKLQALEIKRLLKDYEIKKKDSDSLHYLITTYQHTISELRLELRYRYIREQIENGKYQFFQNGRIISDYSDLVRVDSIKNGKIAEITITFNFKDDSSNPHFVDTDFQEILFSLNQDLLSNYPVTYQLIQSGFIKFSASTESVDHLQYIPINFPYLVSPNNSIQEKKTYAGSLLGFIKQIDKSREFYNDEVLKTYSKVEIKKVPTGNIDQLIRLRINFITYLKNIYYARYPNRKN
jgi:hypothetical protein